MISSNITSVRDSLVCWSKLMLAYHVFSQIVTLYPFLFVYKTADKDKLLYNLQFVTRALSVNSML